MKQVFYDAEGKEHAKLSEELVFAQHANNANGDSYYVAMVLTGMDAGHFLNTQSMWYNADAKRVVDPNRGASNIQLKKVTQEVFDLYVKFLKTKNVSYLRNAERVK